MTTFSYELRIWGDFVTNCETHIKILEAFKRGWVLVTTLGCWNEIIELLGEKATLILERGDHDMLSTFIYIDAYALNIITPVNNCMLIFLSGI